MRRARTLAVLALIVAAAVPGVVAAASVDVAVSSVSVSPDQPVPGDEVTIRSTVENFASSSAGYFIDKVAIIDENDDGDELASVRDIGVVAAGDSRSVPLTVSFEEAGSKDLRVQVLGRSTTTGRQTRLRYPVSITVSDRTPQLAIDADDTAVGVRQRGTVTVANTVGSSLSDLQLQIGGENVTITNRREVIASLAANESATVDFRYAPRSAGPHDLTATLTYTTAGGTTDSVSISETFQARETQPQVAVSVNDTTVGVRSPATVTVENVLGGDLRNADLSVSGDGVTTPNSRRVLGTVAENESATVRFEYLTESAGTYDLTATLTYTTDGGVTDSVTETVRVRSEDRDPQVAVEANDSVVGVRADGTVSVANGLDTALRSAELTVSGDGVTTPNSRQILGTVGRNATEQVQFEYLTESAGTHDLTVTLTYTTDGGVTDSVTETVTVRSEDRHPQIGVDVNDSVAGTASDGTVTVANGLGTAITNLEVTVDSEDGTVSDDRTVFTRLENGESVETGFTVEPAAAGENELAVTLQYTTDNGLSRTVTQPVAFTTDPLRDRVTLDVSASVNSETPMVTVDVLNQGNAPVTNVTLSGQSPNATVQRALVSRVGAGESRTVRLNATLDSERAAVDVQATYDVGDRRGERSGTTTLTRVPGTIGLTGVSVTDQGGRLQISGSASNFGTTDAESVVVRVQDTENVTPAQPNREFFVGTVPASDFVSFDVYATATGNVSAVPLEVSYLVDGERITRTVEVDAQGVAAAPEPRPDGGTDGGSGGSGLGVVLPVVVGLVVAAAVVAIIVRAWRNSRGGD